MHIDEFTYFLISGKTIYRNSTSYVAMCQNFLTFDDTLVGAIIQLLLGYKLTEVEAMLSHVEVQEEIKPELLKDLVGQTIAKCIHLVILDVLS